MKTRFRSFTLIVLFASCANLFHPILANAGDKKKKQPTQAELAQQWKQQEIQRQQQAAAQVNQQPVNPGRIDPNAGALAGPLLQVGVINNSGVAVRAVRFLPDGTSGDFGQIANGTAQTLQTRAGMRWVFSSGGQVLKQYTVSNSPQQQIIIGGGQQPIVKGRGGNSGGGNGGNSGGNGGGGASSPQIQSFLQVHNNARAAVGVGPLIWSSQLAQKAQQWANHLASLPSAQVRANPHRPDGSGENFGGGTGSYSPADAARAWLSEKSGYRYGPFNGQAGHYTQMVWRSTNSVGFGIATSGDGWTYVVANYGPAGNDFGQPPY